MSGSTGLPRGWIEAPLHGLGTWYGGGTPSKFNDAFWSNGTIPWISPKDMKSLQLTDSEDHISSAAIEQTNIKAFPPGTVLVVIRSGILSRTLPVAVARVAATMNQDLKGIFPNPGIDSLYLAYYLRSEEHRILKKCSKHGTTVASIDTHAIHSYSCRLAPTNEQRRIVAKIEELFSDLDAGVAALERAKANLKRYRAAVLKAAVNGSLTAAWRAKYPDIEPASKLLERILVERHRKWEAAQLAKFKAAGKEPPKNWKAKYVEPSPPDTTDLPDLPEGWCWATLDGLSNRIVDGTHHTPTYVENGVPFISVKDVRDGTVYFDDCKFISHEEHVALTQRCKPEQGDLLITKSGTIGRVAVVAEETAFSLFVSVALLKPVSALIDVSWLALAFQAWMQTVNVANDIKGSMIKNLHIEDLRVIKIPIPSAVEQDEIISEVDHVISNIVAAEHQLDASLLRAARLRQSILKQAFEGKLVLQDPNDEPAAVLLDRIKSESQPHKTNGKPAKSRPRKKTKQEAT